LRGILEARKKLQKSGNGLPFPIFLFLEEAHLLAPFDIETLSKYWIGRVR